MSKAQSTPKLSVEGGRVHVRPQGQPRAVDRSGNDWHVACLYFEAHPKPTVGWASGLAANCREAKPGPHLLSKLF